MYQKMMNLGCFFVVAVFLLQVASDTLILGFPQAVTLNRICLFCPNYNIPRVPLQNCCGLFLKAVNQRSEDNHLLLSSTSADSTVKAVYFLSILSAIPWREMQYLLVLVSLHCRGKMEQGELSQIQSLKELHSPKGLEYSLFREFEIKSLVELHKIDHEISSISV